LVWSGVGLRRQVIYRFPHRIEGVAVAEQLAVAAVDDHQGVVEFVVVECVHDLAAC
jgi:hypothetical protein